MMRTLSRWSLLVLVVVVLAFALPQLYAVIFVSKVARTQLFYSPVRSAFVFREHHGDHDFTYADNNGNVFDRKTFETQIPFIYYKNMDIWGLLPLTINGQTYDMETIRNGRQVLELAPTDVRDRRPEIEVYPLIESNPGRARLRFPEDVFRMTPTRMEFINVDDNRIDEDLTQRFTEALTSEGFRFPARLVAGKPTILKPFDEGYFIVDDSGAVFHVKRVDGAPQVTHTGLPSELAIRHIKVSENKRRLFYGFLLTEGGDVSLISYDDYALVPLPAEGYDPDSMIYKLILNPVHPTAIFDNNDEILAVAMTPDFQPIDRYQRPVPGTHDQLFAQVARGLFPFVVTLDDPTGRYLVWRLDHHGWASLIGLGLSVAVLLAWTRARRLSWRSLWPEILLVAITGVYGLIATMVVPGVTGRRRGDERPVQDTSRGVAEAPAAHTAAS